MTSLTKTAGCGGILPILELSKSSTLVLRIRAVCFAARVRRFFILLAVNCRVSTFASRVALQLL